MFRNVKYNHEEQTIHPCQFPEDLIARIVLATTVKGNIVLDPYMVPVRRQLQLKSAIGILSGQN